MVAPITVKIDGEPKGLIDGLNTAGRSVKVFGHDVGVDLPGKMGLAVDATKAVLKVTKAVGGAARDAAAEEEIFQQAMSKATGESADYNAALDDTINQSMKLAFTDTETRKALAALTTATGDAEAATGLLAGAQDIARLAGVDLETASDAVAKAYAGQDKALKALLPGLQSGATANETIANATALAEGASDSYAKSAEATGLKAKNAFGEIAEVLGSALVPMLKAVGAILKPIVQIFGELLKIVLPPLTRMLERLAGVLDTVARVLQRVADAISRLIDRIKALLQPLTDAVNKLRELGPDFLSRNAAAASVTQVTRVAAFGVEPTANANRTGGVTINIYGDPSVIEARVTKALRDYARRNGVGAVFTPERT